MWYIRNQSIDNKRSTKFLAKKKNSFENNHLNLRSEVALHLERKNPSNEAKSRDRRFLDRLCMRL